MKKNIIMLALISCFVSSWVSAEEWMKLSSYIDRNVKVSPRSVPSKRVCLMLVTSLFKAEYENNQLYSSKKDDFLSGINIEDEKISFIDPIWLRDDVIEAYKIEHPETPINRDTFRRSFSVEDIEDVSVKLGSSSSPEVLRITLSKTFNSDLKVGNELLVEGDKPYRIELGIKSKLMGDTQMVAFNGLIPISDNQSKYVRSLRCK